MAEKTADAIALLKADHRVVEDLFEKFESAKEPAKLATLAKQICTELMVHATIEEEIFYPACKGKIEDEELLDEAYVEHDGAKVLIAELLQGSPSHEFYDAKVKVLSEEIRHHVQEEERWLRGMFSQARRTDIDMTSLGLEIFNRKEELLSIEKNKGLPPAKLTTI
jgi:hemerythrin superfamily protein